MKMSKVILEILDCLLDLSAIVLVGSFLGLIICSLIYYEYMWIPVWFLLILWGFVRLITRQKELDYRNIR